MVHPDLSWRTQKYGHCQQWPNGLEVTVVCGEIIVWVVLKIEWAYQCMTKNAIYQLLKYKD